MPAAVSAGSSPLARGLPRLECAIIVDDRIIPARAGFTNLHDVIPRRSEDHPRSRGVYNDMQLEWDAAHGSSPLARGLLVVGAGLGVGGRIIPARAGFTCSVNSRSGVVSGSSPLARGLPERRRERRRTQRIIPARAGFT